MTEDVITTIESVAEGVRADEVSVVDVVVAHDADDSKAIVVALEDQGGEQQVVTQCEQSGVVESIAIGPQGAPGGVGYWLKAAVAIGGHRAIAVDQNGLAVYGDCRDIGQVKRVIGISLNAADEGGMVRVIREGEISEASWDWDSGKVIYLGENGVLTQSAPNVGFSLIVGFPVGAQKIIVSIGEPIILH